MVAAGQGISAGGFKPVFAVFGSDAYLRTGAVRSVIRAVLGPDADPMAITEFEGKEAALADVLDACRTPTLMSPLCVVLVRDAGDFIKRFRKALEKYLAHPSDCGALVLTLSTKLAANTRLYKLISKVGRNIPCEPPKLYELPKWATDHAREQYGARLDSGAARRLVDLVGDDLGRLDSEIAKLTVYVGAGRGIAAADVEKIVGFSRVEKIFGLTDAVARKDAPAALVLWDQVLANDRAAPFKAIGGVAYAFRRLAEAKRLVEQGLPIQQAIRAAGLWGDPADLRRQITRFSASRWQDHLVELLRIDTGAKSGLGTVRSSMEKLIVKLCC